MNRAKIINRQTGLVVREVKNLGWLMRHIHEVGTIHVDYDHDIEGRRTVRMRADLVGNLRFVIQWADERVLEAWLRARKGLNGAEVDWQVGPEAARCKCVLRRETGSRVMRLLKM